MDLPLTGVRVVDLTDGTAEMTSRILADLGADVVRAEPVHGAATRRRDLGLYYATHNANKRAVALEHDDPDFARLVDGADLVVTDGSHGGPPAGLRNGRPSLVVVSVTDFGLTGPYRDWQGSEAVHLALGGVLSRSGLPGRTPLLPPGTMAYESAAAQAAWAGLVAYFNRLRTGAGDLVDVSVYEATAQALDPGFGIAGSATGGVPAANGPRGRPDARHLYPIFRCADGWVRICILAPRQWKGMFTWLGEPAEFADPALASLGTRFAESGRIYAAIGRFFATRTRDRITTEAERYGVPAAALLTPTEVLDSPQFTARGALTEVAGVPGARMPNGFLEVDGERAGIRRPAPAHGQHTAEVLAALTTPPDRPAPAAPADRARPFAGLRVLDLGVIVVGAELGRLFADLGAEVIKVENRAFPDGSRQTRDGSVISASFAYGHRNKLGLGLNLRDPRGAAVFRRLVAESDVVLSNFKPGTLESLGLGYAELSQINPGIVMADSSAFGPTGPWSRRMGYGPLVRAASGISMLWRYPEDEDGFSDASTVYPDHVAARIEAVAVLAKIISRRATGRGGTVSVAQAEIILGQLAHQLAAESVRPGGLAAFGNDIPGDAPRGVFACDGDDEWCVVTVRGDDDWSRLGAVLGVDPGDARFRTPADRVAHRAEVNALLTAWTSARAPRRAMADLQDAGVPAAMMHRVIDLLDDPHLTARGFFRRMRHPRIADVMPTENGPALFGAIADPPLEPAPVIGEHSRTVLTRVLGMTTEEFDALAADGVVEQLQEEHA
ncbi:crotonobetainyl-CoA:carnitine CoA-transferase CaiB-like acyl-CoA transferase [Catenuloplanes nepalensis]|uniref:Crotonobetainyl-CoA:carnitine CoA-transferase CaiB-like acyl-CoA transferase n=1 Tax=Catenuloplanes nepalensis TaxID=587533 RepID=A0ABT9MNG4_9ACTN|nr:CoA transferase [Catenuloplanes nepalensis]MDP9792971.1 crotonobetainyl-CoA:carnitine CoA-transferase CaiB-like acyl-CoA transferase [Catenuloplanes nepalensis]